LFWGNEPASAAAAEPGEDVVEAGADLCQVKHGLLDPSARWNPGRVPDDIEPAALVDGDRRDQLIPFTGRDAELLTVT
jgi:hypothetical protein